jgi:hypothetical protein
MKKIKFYLVLFLIANFISSPNAIADNTINYEETNQSIINSDDDLIYMPNARINIIMPTKNVANQKLKEDNSEYKPSNVKNADSYAPGKTTIIGQ